MWDSTKSFLVVFLVILFATNASAVGSHAYYGEPQMDFSAQETANYTEIVSKWDYRESIDMDERWNGNFSWGNDHHVFAVRLNTKELISQGKMRKDCADIRVAWKESVVASRVEAGTCNTEDTWVYFSNSMDGDGYRFDPSEKVKEIELFYGNPDPGVQAYTVSPSNANPASALHPEGAIETYFGTHCGNTYTNHNTHLHNNDKSAPSQTWHVDFNHCHYGDVGTRYIHISDDDGNGVHRGSGDTYTIDSSNAPSWLQEGDTVTVHFHSNSAGDGSSTSSSSRSAQYGYSNQPPNQPWNPRPSDGATVYTQSPTLKVDVSDPNGDTMDVTFYTTSASSGSLVSESFESYSNGDTLSQISGFYAGSDCGTCRVSNNRASDGSMSFYQNINTGDNWQDALRKDFSSSITGQATFSYSYWETSSNHDGNLWIESCSGQKLAGVGTENPQREVVNNNGELVKDGSGAYYQHWIRVEMGVDVPNDQFTVRFTDLNNGNTWKYGPYNFGASANGVCSMGIGPDNVWYVDDISVTTGSSTVATTKTIEPKVAQISGKASGKKLKIERSAATSAATNTVSPSGSEPGQADRQESPETVYVSESSGHSHSGASYYGSFTPKPEESRPLNYSRLVDEWRYRESIDMDERWNGNFSWGNDHHVFAVRLNTKKLISQGKMRKDCADIRMAWRERLVGSRVEAGTCNTEDTWVYFSNSIEGEGYRFNPDEKVRKVELFYGNPSPGSSGLAVSPSNNGPATFLHPEGAIETYFGTHCGNTYTNHNTHLHNNDKSAPSQTWHASFYHCHSGGVGTRYIHISDDDGNGVHRGSGDTYTIDSSNAPAWLDGGDTVSVHFHSNSAGADGTTSTSSTRSAEWGTVIEGTKINTDSNVGSGSTASVSWSGLECGKTYDWFAVADDGKEKTKSPTWSFTVYCNGPPKIISGPNFADRPGSRHSFSTSAVIYDRDGDDDISSCDLDVDDGDGNSNSYTMILDRAYGNGSEAQCIYEYVNYADQGGWGHLETMNAQVTATDSNGASGSESGSYAFPNNNPSVNANMDFHDYTGEHAFNASAVLFDGDDFAGELDRCEFEFDDRDGNVYTRTGDLDTGYGEEDQAMCNYSKIDRSFSGFKVNEQIDIKVTGYDIHGASAVASSSHPVPNQLPSITLVGPQDGSDQEDDVINLEVQVSNSDDNPMDVYFYDGDDNRLGFETVTSGGTADAQWDDVVSGGAYEWYVKVDDSHENATSPTWDFRKVTSQSFRVNSELQYEYSAIITSMGKPAYVDFTVRNVVSETKDLETRLSGVNAEFLSTGTSTTSYTLNGNDEKSFRIMINPNSNGMKTLTVTTENTDLQTTNIDRFPVFVRDDVAVSGEVPGITAVQVLVLVLTASMLYWFRF